MPPESNEYEWEREIRCVELRISRYFQALPRYLDLPGEDEIIYSKLAAQAELAPVHENSYPWQFLKPEADEEEDGISEEEVVSSLRLNPGFDLFLMLEAAVREWNAFAGFNFESREQIHFGLYVAGCYGKMLSRVYNFVEIGNDPGAHTLKLSLMKRVLAELNILAGIFTESHSPVMKEFEPDFIRFAENLKIIRERALKFIFEA